LRSDLAKFGGVTEPSLPRHDLILLPLVSLLTVILMLGGGEALARLAFPKHTSIACVSKTQDAGERFQPNCVALTKAAEGPWVENRFNECGYRTAEPCAAKQPGQLRVVVLGSSTARGALVPYAETFARGRVPRCARAATGWWISRIWRPTAATCGTCPSAWPKPYRSRRMP
jgi:hypothetical protein